MEERHVDDPLGEQPSRRRFLRWMAVLAAGGWSLPGMTAPDAGPLPSAAEDALDEALTRFSKTGPEYRGGLANHGPMAADALVAMRRPDAVSSWVDVYIRSLDERPSPRDPIARDGWRETLGQARRMGDWIAFFERELAESDWRQALGRWAGALAPGLVGAAMHGVIRTGHAARALARKETPRRVAELAEGLAYWAASHATLPERRGRPVRGVTPSQALPDVALVPAERQIRSGFILRRASTLEGFEPFLAVAGAVDVTGDAGLFVSDVTASFARLYLAQAQRRAALITYIHAVTGPAAVRPLLPWVDAGGGAALLRYAWQAAAGLHASHGEPGLRAPEPAGPSLAAEELIDRAVANGDEHAIKLTEVCLREDALRTDPAYARAAADASARLARSG
ncbi:MAG TPA: questin oxidase family protein [Candidatus Polarisedimenticolia bacterium]|nr:questin oxidase family protein [Candidatus Polarisedimenticolia bacterium]